MFNELFNFPNKKERNDFFIALLVICFFGLLFFKIFWKGDENVNLDIIDDKSNIEIVIDTDGDGIRDEIDDCPLIIGVESNNGCPESFDSDSDGIIDEKDACPNVAGLASNNGCPIDSDGDGIYDEEDECPELAGIAKNNGCPADSDSDGIYDKDDKCPKRKGLAKLNGCPKANLKSEEKAVFVEAMKAIEFETGSATLKASSTIILDKIYAIMLKYPSYKVTIIGHTDNTSTPEKNLALSQERAISTASYLIQRGIKKSRLKTKGLGQVRPIDTNETPQGRQNNRRVEFEFNY